VPPPRNVGEHHVLRETAYSFNLARLARASFSTPSIGRTLNGFPPRLVAEGSLSVPPSIGEGDAWLGSRIGDVASEGGRMTRCGRNSRRRRFHQQRCVPVMVSLLAFCGNLSDRQQLFMRRNVGLCDRLLCVHFKLRKAASAKAG
jgi:hypothetical protein